MDMRGRYGSAARIKNYFSWKAVRAFNFGKVGFDANFGFAELNCKCGQSAWVNGYQEDLGLDKEKGFPLVFLDPRSKI